MNFKVLNRKEAIEYTKQVNSEKSIIISISSSYELFPEFERNTKNKVLNILYLTLDDICKMSDDTYLVYVDESKTSYTISDKENFFYASFTKKEADEVIDFVERWKDETDLIICHCDAGISRSSGCCAAIMRALTGSDITIFKNPYFCPNMMIYSILIKRFAERGYFDK